jgi:adenosine deaminase/adenosine deaminase CECR1
VELGTIFFDKQEEIIYIQKIMEKWSAKDYNGVSYLINYFLKPLIKFSPTIPGHFGQVY